MSHYNTATKYLDTRDLYERKCELEDLRDTLNSAREELAEAEQAVATLTPEDDGEEIENSIESARDSVELAQGDFGPDEETELRELEELKSEVGREFMHGETLIRESDFEDYARELAEEIHGNAMRNAEWPFNCIDWKEAADELRMDYSSVTYQGTDYLFRS